MQHSMDMLNLLVSPYMLAKLNVRNNRNTLMVLGELAPETPPPPQ